LPTRTPRPQPTARPTQIVQTANKIAGCPDGCDITDISWSPDGKRIAYGTHMGPVTSSNIASDVIVVDAEKGLEIARLQGHTGYVTAVSWNLDGTRLASSSHDNSVIIWDPQTGTILKTLEGHEVNIAGSGYVTDLAWSPDGKVIASSGWDSTVRTWDAETGAPIRTFQGNGRQIWYVEWTSDGEKLVALEHSRGGGDSVIWIWDAQTNGLLADLSPSDNRKTATSMVVSPDGRQLAVLTTAGLGSGIDTEIWDIRTGSVLLTIDGDEANTSIYTKLAWHPDGKQLAIGSSIFDASSGSLLATLGMQKRLSVVAWSPDGKRLAGNQSDGTGVGGAGRLSRLLIWPIYADR